MMIEDICFHKWYADKAFCRLCGMSLECFLSEDKLKKAIKIATFYHQGQKRKFENTNYIVHPLRIMKKAETTEEEIVAVLHDVVEDTHLTLQKLKRAGFSQKITTAIRYLTRKESENYKKYIERVSKNKLARKIKILDLIDNLSLKDVKNIAPKIIRRQQKYKEALAFLKNYES